MAKPASRPARRSKERIRKEAIEPIYAEVGTRIGQVRREGEWTQEALSEAVGISQNMVARIEAGYRRVPLHTLAAIAEALEVPLVELLPSDEREPPPLSSKLLKSLSGLSRGDQALVRPLIERLKKA